MVIVISFNFNAFFSQWWDFVGVEWALLGQKISAKKTRASRCGNVGFTGEELEDVTVTKMGDIMDQEDLWSDGILKGLKHHQWSVFFATSKCREPGKYMEDTLFIQHPGNTFSYFSTFWGPLSENKCPNKCSQKVKACEQCPNHPQIWRSVFPSFLLSLLWTYCQV